MYFNEHEVFPPDSAKINVTDGCVCTGDENYYEDCNPSQVSRPRGHGERVAGVLCAK